MAEIDHDTLRVKEYTNRLTEIYKVHNPDKVEEIPKLLEKYAGKEHTLYIKVCRKYNVKQEPKWRPPEPEEASYEERAAAYEKEWQGRMRTFGGIRKRMMEREKKRKAPKNAFAKEAEAKEAENELQQQAKLCKVWIKKILQKQKKLKMNCNNRQNFVKY